MTKHGSTLTGNVDQPLSGRAAALATLTAALWGGTPVAVSFSAESLPPVMVAAVRFAMASVFMLFWCRFENSPMRLGPGQLKLSLIAKSVKRYNKLGLAKMFRNVDIVNPDKSCLRWLFFNNIHDLVMNKSIKRCPATSVAVVPINVYVRPSCVPPIN